MATASLERPHAGDGPARDRGRARRELAAAVEQLREGLGEATDVAGKLRGEPARRRRRRARRRLLPRGRDRRDDALPRPQGPRTLTWRASVEIGRAPSSPWRLSAREWVDALQARLQVVPRRRRDGPLRAGRVQLAARVLPGDGLPRRPARPVRRLRRAEGVPRPGRAGRRARRRSTRCSRTPRRARRSSRSSSAPPARSGRRAAR